MIVTANQYANAKKRIEEDRKFAEIQRAALEAKGPPPAHVDLAMQPLLSFHAQLQEEVA